MNLLQATMILSKKQRLDHPSSATVNMQATIHGNAPSLAILASRSTGKSSAFSSSVSPSPTRGGGVK